VKTRRRLGRPCIVNDWRHLRTVPGTSTSLLTAPIVFSPTH
jgi:hypothetical protein